MSFLLCHLELIFCEQWSSYSLNVMFEGSLHFPSVIEIWLSLKTPFPCSHVEATLLPCPMYHEAQRCPPWFSALSKFPHYLSITTVSKKCMPPHYTTHQSSLCSHILSHHYSPYLLNVWQLAHHLFLQRTPASILGNFKNHRGDPFNSGFSFFDHFTNHF